MSVGKGTKTCTVFASKCQFVISERLYAMLSILYKTRSKRKELSNSYNDLIRPCVRTACAP